MVSDASEAEPTTRRSHNTVAEGMARAFRKMGRNCIAYNIVESMRAAGYEIREHDPFETQIQTILSADEQSPLMPIGSV